MLEEVKEGLAVLGISKERRRMLEKGLVEVSWVSPSSQGGRKMTMVAQSLVKNNTVNSSLQPPAGSHPTSVNPQ